MPTGAEVLVQCLINQDTDCIYGVPGESYLAVLDALYDVQDRIKFINTRHEGGAAFMAESYGKFSAKAGVCFVTRGPGATNASIGVHTAMQNSSPMVLFIGQIGREMKDREAFQEVDYRAFFGPLAKWVTEIDDPKRIPELVGRAFKTALSGRPGPVVVSLPEDMLRESVDVKPCRKMKALRPTPDPADIANISSAINSARKPIMLVAGGGWTQEGRQHLNTFVNGAKIPTIASFRCQDLVDNTSQYYCGDAAFGKSPALKAMINDADLILAVNTRFGEVVTDGWSLLDQKNTKAKIIHTHISEAELSKVYQCDTEVISCPNSLFAALNDQTITPNWDDWAHTCHTGYKDSIKTPKTTGDVNPAEICRYLDTVLDDDCIITTGAGNFAIWPSKYISYHHKRRLIAPQSGAMGAGLPSAVALKIAQPKRDVICFAGDGDLQMTLQELGVAKEQGIYPVIILLNNKTYGTIRMHQELRHPDRVSYTDITNPDFKYISTAYGMKYHHIDKTDDFKAAFKDVKSTGGLIELSIDTRDIAPGKTI